MNITYCSPHLIHKIKFWVYPKSSFCGSIRICNLDLSEYRTHFTEQYCLCLSKQNLTWMALCKNTERCSSVAGLWSGRSQQCCPQVCTASFKSRPQFIYDQYQLRSFSALYHSDFFFLSRCETVGISNVLMVNCLFKDDVEEKLRSKITSRSILKVAVRQLVDPQMCSSLSFLSHSSERVSGSSCIFFNQIRAACLSAFWWGTS